jgi:hypothetical protein
MTSSSSNRDVPSDPASQPAPHAEGGEEVSESAATTPPKREQLEQLLDTDFEVWLRHFGAC